jgi:anti-sigma B factor antagonist
MSLDLSTARVGPYEMVSVGGELDVTSHRDFDEYLRALYAGRQDRPPHVVVDLGELTFLDTTGLSVLVRHWQELVEAGGTLTLAGATYGNARVLWTTGLIGRIPIVTDLADLADLPEPDAGSAAS